ncbi:MAG: pyruvate dehydrogenase complex dihydrolipoamide acetyltransferase [Rhodospirillaceae bacterium]|nr:pyruvate dehydrogenase complex dihydrolipoamide acetyltransferase [Rhodospirillaceae bacterium]|tara:strand:- start:291 stop:1553 length:1263 start_codon:yes stop_codon:yes gene_type:complete
MAVEVLLPALSPTMTEGTLAKWLKKEGETIRAGDVLAEVETDKATMEIEAIDDGTLEKILIPEGTDGIPINTPIGIIAEEGVVNEVKNSPLISALTETKLTQPPLAGKTEESVKDEQTHHNVNSEGRILASPLAKKMALQENLDLSTIRGTGPKGRIVKGDVLEAVNKSFQQPNFSEKKPKGTMAKSQESVVLDNPFHTASNTSMRRVIAQRLSESKSTIPHFYMTIGVEIDKLLDIRTQLNNEEELSLSINDFFIRATALALKSLPTANASWGLEETIYYERVDVAVAVAVPGGLLTPVVKDAGNKGLASISAEMKELAKKARAGELLPEQYQGGTFSISNLGMYGVREFSAVINPPQAGILAIGASTEKPVVKNSAIAIATCVDCTLSCDHRVINGATGAELLGAIKGFIENPLTLML